MEGVENSLFSHATCIPLYRGRRQGGTWGLDPPLAFFYAISSIM